MFGAAGCQAAFAVPIYAGGRLWGGLITASMDPNAYTGEDARRQIELSELAGQAIGNIEAQEQLVRLGHQRSADGADQPPHLPGADAGGRSPRPDRGVDLTLALLDIDDFRVVNEMRGHRTGDTLLAAPPGPCAPFPGPATCWPGWAGTSSRSCSRASTR